MSKAISIEVLPALTPRGRLRRLATTDLAAFQAYRRDPDIGRFQGWSPQGDAEAGAFLAAMNAAPLFAPGAWSQIAIVDGADALIGDIGVCLARDAETAELGFTLAGAAQGRGLAREAVAAAIALVFRHTPATRILCVTDERNAPAQRLIARLSMTLERQSPALFRGQACTEFHYALARDRWAGDSDARANGDARDA